MLGSDKMEQEKNMLEIINHVQNETLLGKTALIISIVAIGVCALDIVMGIVNKKPIPSTSIWGGVSSAGYIASAITSKIFGNLKSNENQGGKSR
jgi:hypothetical protein